MKFEEALKAMREGKKAKLSFGEMETIFYIKDEDIISESFCDNERECGPEASHWLIPEEILSEDWEIVDDNS